MKKIFFFFTIVLSGSLVVGQDLAINQNPDFAVSRDKYIKLSDSINQWQSTTGQQTYKAIDYLVDKQEARDARKQFRRDLRMERASRDYINVGNDGYYSPYNNYNNYGGYPPYRSSFYGRSYFNGWAAPRIWGGISAPFFWHGRYR